MQTWKTPIFIGLTGITLLAQACSKKDDDANNAVRGSSNLSTGFCNLALNTNGADIQNTDMTGGEIASTAVIADSYFAGCSDIGAGVVLSNVKVKSGKLSTPNTVVGANSTVSDTEFRGADASDYSGQSDFLKLTLGENVEIKSSEILSKSNFTLTAGSRIMTSRLGSISMPINGAGSVDIVNSEINPGAEHTPLIDFQLGTGPIKILNSSILTSSFGYTTVLSQGEIINSLISAPDIKFAADFQRAENCQIIETRYIVLKNDCQYDASPTPQY